jgi:hypothetical protein
LLTLGLGLRLFDLTDPPIDFHPTRQLRGAIIARGMYYEMLPSADEGIRQQAINFWRSTGQYEPSILERLAAITYLIVGREIWWVARLFNSLIWVGCGIALFSLARRMALSRAAETSGSHAAAIATASAFFALAYYLVLPFSVQASRSFQPDPVMVAWIILTAYALFRWAEQPGWKWALLAGALAGMAVLTKAVAFYTVAGAMFATVLYVTFSRAAHSRRTALKMLLTNPQVWGMAILMVLPTAVYYLGREGRASEYFSSWTLSLAHLLLEANTYLRWGNLVQELINPLALLAGLAGLVLARGLSRALLLGLWGGYLAYGMFLPYQMYTHNYYHLQLVPIVALSIVPAAQFVLERLAARSRVWLAALVVAALLLIVYSSWQAVIPQYSQDHRNEPSYWGQIASYLPSDGKIVALTQDYGYRLMYYGWRKVTLWPNRGEQQLNRLRGDEKEFAAFFNRRTQDKQYFLITAFRQFDDQPDLKKTLYDRYPILAEGQGYVIFDLTNPEQNPGSP